MVEKRRCGVCGEIKKIEEFYKDKKGRGGYGYRCKPCARAVSRRDYEVNKEARRKTNAAYRARPEIRRNTRDYLLQRKYGISSGEYDALLKKQKGVCGICGLDRKDSRGREMPVDHDHVTGRVRGILCDHCNRILGLLKDDPAVLRAAVAYLKAWAKVGRSA